MSTTFRKAGHSHTHTAGADIAAGEVIGPIGTGNRFGVAITTIANGATGALDASGIHELAANSADTWADGDILYWDAADDNLTDDADSGTNKQIGYAVGAKDSSVTVAEVLLNGLPK